MTTEVEILTPEEQTELKELIDGNAYTEVLLFIAEKHKYDFIALKFHDIIWQRDRDGGMDYFLSSTCDIAKNDLKRKLIQDLGEDIYKQYYAKLI